MTRATSSPRIENENGSVIVDSDGGIKITSAAGLNVNIASDGTITIDAADAKAATLSNNLGSVVISTDGTITIDAADAKAATLSNNLGSIVIGTDGAIRLTPTVGVGIGSAAVANQMVTIADAALAATGRILKLSATLAAAALTDGYGAFEVDVTLSGSPTDHAAAASAWVNITGGTVPAGTYICARNDGIYEAAAATVTNAKLIFGARMQYIVSDTDALRFPWSINTNNVAITALIDVNNLSDLGTVANAGATAATLLPICRDVGGTLKYVLLYNLA